MFDPVNRVKGKHDNCKCLGVHVVLSETNDNDKAEEDLNELYKRSFIRKSRKLKVVEEGEAVRTVDLYPPPPPPLFFKLRAVRAITSSHHRAPSAPLFTQSETHKG